jgi:uncharacterized protein YjbJ (UPF0337 family)
MSGLVDRISGRVKKAAGDLADDSRLREQGIRDERKADAKDELVRAQREADERADEVARLEREAARERGGAGATAGRAGAAGRGANDEAGAADPAGADDPAGASH